MKNKKLFVEAGAFAVLLLAGILFMLFSRPAAPEVLIEQAQQAVEKGDYEKASGLYLAALKKQPENTEALRGLAEAASHLENNKNLEAALRKLIELEPAEWQHYYDLINLYLKEGRPEQADVILQQLKEKKEVEAEN
ncbi:MAG: tetratricopeptide repeat protein [Oscillospiraceae bacterium]|nr:tetratricopeptide repeat protein [Oscillospiraceae bacterium]